MNPEVPMTSEERLRCCTRQDVDGPQSCRATETPPVVCRAGYAGPPAERPAITWRPRRGTCQCIHAASINSVHSASLWQTVKKCGMDAGTEDRQGSEQPSSLGVPAGFADTLH